MGGVGVRHVWQSCEGWEETPANYSTKYISLISITQPLYFVG